MEPVEYTVDLSARHAHLFGVEARFPVGGGPLELKLPVWTPGSYLIREYQRHVQELVCDDGDGNPLPVVKIGKSTWRVDAAGAARVRARYRVYGYELTVRTAHLDDTHAFWNGACLFLYADTLVDRPARVTVRAPEDWRVTVGLDAEPAAPHTFRAASYDELVDSPFEVGTHELHAFSAQGKPHRLAIWGRTERRPGTLIEDITKIIDAAAEIFRDGVPYPDYTFLLLLAPGAYGGLEHARSAALLNSPFGFHPRKKYEELLELIAHEYFHLWNVKRIHPVALGPFDYQREAHTRALWVMEGVTSYYDRHLLVRAGLQPPDRYLEKLSEELTKIAAIPGRRRQSLEESGFDAWIKLYRPDENTVNSTISYYLKGGVVALFCDLEIRTRTDGQRSLDDVMRLLWRRHGARGEGFADEAVQALFEEASGIELGEFFNRYVRGREELDAAPLLRRFGLELTRSAGDDETPPPWLGVNTKEEAGALMVAAALDDGPAVAAGLYAGDQLVALDGFRVDAASLKDRLAMRQAGDVVTLTVFRRDELRTIPVTLAARPADKHELVPVENPTAAERAAYQSWLGQPFPTDEA